MILHAELSAMDNRELQQRFDDISKELDNLIASLERQPLFGDEVQNTRSREMTNRIQQLQPDYDLLRLRIEELQPKPKKVEFFR